MYLDDLSTEKHLMLQLSNNSTISPNSPLNSVEIINRAPLQWSIHSLSPGFTHEHFPLILQITQSNIDVPVVKKACLKLKLSDDDALKCSKILYQSDSSFTNSEIMESPWVGKIWTTFPTELNLPDITSGSSFYIPLCLFSELPGDVSVSFTLTWNEEDVVCVLDSFFTIQFISPFKCNARYFSAKIPDHTDKSADNSSLLCSYDAHVALDLENLSKHPLKLEKLSLNKTEGSNDVDLQSEELYCIGPLGRFSTIAKINPSISGKVSVGSFNLCYSRNVSSSILFGKEFNDLLSTLPTSKWEEALAPINIEHAIFDVNYGFYFILSCFN